MDALLSQRALTERCEILMVDNNSTDRGPELVAQRSGVRLLHEPRQGVYAARNRGVAEARGQILVFLDPDCVAAPAWLESLLANVRRSGAKLVVGRKDPGGGGYALQLLGAYENAKMQFVFGTRTPSLYSGDCATMAVRREVFDELGPFEEKVRGGDTLLAVAAAERFGCDAVSYEPAARVAHLEVMSLREAYGKMFIYGRSRRRNIGGAMQRPLTSAQRAELVRRAVAGEPNGILASAMLTALLTGSVGAFRAGTLAGRWGR